MEARGSELILIQLLKEKPYNQESSKSSKLPQKQGEIKPPSDGHVLGELLQLDLCSVQWSGKTADSDSKPYQEASISGRGKYARGQLKTSNSFWYCHYCNKNTVTLKRLETSTKIQDWFCAKSDKTHKPLCVILMKRKEKRLRLLNWEVSLETLMESL